MTGGQVQGATGLSRSRAYAVLRELRAETASPNGQPHGLERQDAGSSASASAQ